MNRAKTSAIVMLVVAGSVMGCAPGSEPSSVAPTTASTSSAPSGLDTKVSPHAHCSDAFRDTTLPCIAG